MQEKTTYKSSGVDIEAGNAFVERLKEKVPTIGGFGGMYKVPRGYEEPILVSGTDGVGTKICICSRLDNYKTIGIDLVAMCVNDIITCGAKPLYFLDYISLNTINPVVDDIMTGIIKGCELAGVELIGGETAEHPMTFDIDLAGFSKNELHVYTEYGKLIVEGKKKEKEKESEYVYQGLAQRSFNRTWSLSEDIEVREVLFKDGLLTVKLG